MRVNFSGGLLLLEKIELKNSTPNSGPKFGLPKFVSKNSALNSGSRGAKSPVRKFVPDIVDQPKTFAEMVTSEGCPDLHL